MSRADKVLDEAKFTQNDIKKGMRLEMKSGLGGSFNVKVTAVDNKGFDATIDMPRNPDFHGWKTGGTFDEIIKLLK